VTRSLRTLAAAILAALTAAPNAGAGEVLNSARPMASDRDEGPHFPAPSDPSLEAALAPLLAAHPELERAPWRLSIVDRGELRPGVWQLRDRLVPPGGAEERLFEVEPDSATVTLRFEGSSEALERWVDANDPTRDPEGEKVGAYDPGRGWMTRRRVTFELPPLPSGDDGALVIRDGGEVLPPEALWAYAPLLAAAEDPHPRVREDALITLSQVRWRLGARFPDWRRFQDVLVAALEDPDPGVRIAAIQGLGAEDPDGAVAAAEALCDPLASVRRAAVRTLRPALSGPRLDRLGLDPDPLVVAIARSESSGRASPDVTAALAATPACEAPALGYSLRVFSPALAEGAVAVTLLDAAGAVVGEEELPATGGWLAGATVTVTAPPARVVMAQGARREEVALVDGAAAALCEGEGAPKLGGAGWPVTLLPALVEGEGCLERALSSLRSLPLDDHRAWLDGIWPLPEEARVRAVALLLELSDAPVAQAHYWIAREGRRARTCHALAPALIDLGLVGQPGLREWTRGCLHPGQRELIQQIVAGVAEGLLPPEALVALPLGTPTYYTREVRPQLEALLGSRDQEVAGAAFALLAGRERPDSDAVVYLRHSPGYVYARRPPEQHRVVRQPRRPPPGYPPRR
jgi:hypothetical protein